ncbi:MAG: class I SAM-dependent methyltransferase [Deltaproteobacteria bacterium]|nr:class I SAM-dependent methyltransferase [Deltaproteobacteria bacterium]
MNRLRAAIRGAGEALALSAHFAAPQHVDAVARAQSWGPRRLQRLVDGLLLEGLLLADADARVRAADRWPTGDRGAPGAALLAQIIQRDRPFDPNQDGLSLRVESAALSVAGLLSDATGAPARELGARLATTLPTTGTCLDAGGGWGDVLAVLLAETSEIRAVLVDRTDRVAMARQRLARHAARLETVSADLVAYAPAPFADVALLNNVLHEHGPRTGATLVARVAHTLRAGGELWIKEPTRGGAEALRACLFALGAAIFTAEGDLYDAATIRTWMTDAGLTDIRTFTLASAPEATVYAGRRP